MFLHHDLHHDFSACSSSSSDFDYVSDIIRGMLLRGLSDHGGVGTTATNNK
jgi:hypothetical protein